MKLAYFDCLSGISGDMTLGALVDLGVPLEVLQRGIDTLGLPECRLEARQVHRHHFRAVHVVVHTAEEHHHRHLHHIEQMLRASGLPEPVQQTALEIFRRLGQAEAKVHGTSLEKVHFHEVGAADSIADIVGTAIGLHHLGVERVEASPVPTGSGTIQIAHGTVTVPAPATAELLQGVPLRASSIEAELTTPTGAAILAALARRFGPLPEMTLLGTGYGAGTRDLDQQPNVLRILLGEPPAAESPWQEEPLWQLEATIDDSPGQWLGHALERLLASGALDAYCVPVVMKKSRPGTLLVVLCREAELQTLQTVLFNETTTLGVRRFPCQRSHLPRRRVEVATPWGSVSGKCYQAPDGTERFAPEYEDCRRLAQQAGVSLPQVVQAALAAFKRQQDTPQPQEGSNPL